MIGKYLETVEKKVEGLNLKAVDVLSGSIGDGGAERVIILLEDGTVAYIKDTLFQETTNLKITGKIEGINNIVRILCCRTTPKEGVQLINTGLTFIAIDKDGYFYDIGLLN